jgi:hypothetical protein
MTQETRKVQAYPTFRPGPGVRGEGTKPEPEPPLILMHYYCGVLALYCAVNNKESWITTRDSAVLGSGRW